VIVHSRYASPIDAIRPECGCFSFHAHGLIGNTDYVPAASPMGEVE
jgi:hypothetical protein